MTKKRSEDDDMRNKARVVLVEDSEAMRENESRNIRELIRKLEKEEEKSKQENSAFRAAERSLSKRLGESRNILESGPAFPMSEPLKRLDERFQDVKSFDPKRDNMKLVRRVGTRAAKKVVHAPREAWNTARDAQDFSKMSGEQLTEIHDLAWDITKNKSGAIGKEFAFGLGVSGALKKGGDFLRRSPNRGARVAGFVALGFSAMNAGISVSSASRSLNETVVDHTKFLNNGMLGDIGDIGRENRMKNKGRRE